jgi:hypothetical protein
MCDDPPQPLFFPCTRIALLPFTLFSHASPLPFPSHLCLHPRRALCGWGVKLVTSWLGSVFVKPPTHMYGRWLWRHCCQPARPDPRTHLFDSFNTTRTHALIVLLDGLIRPKPHIPTHFGLHFVVGSTSLLPPKQDFETMVHYPRNWDGEKGGQGPARPSRPSSVHASHRSQTPASTAAPTPRTTPRDSSFSSSLSSTTTAITTHHHLLLPLLYHAKSNRSSSSCTP